MNKLRYKLAKGIAFAKFNLKNGFHLLRLRECDECKTTFRTMYGLYEYLVRPFRLCNAPFTFQAMINTILYDLQVEGVIAYIGKILIYTKSEQEHVQLIQKYYDYEKQNSA